MAKTPLGKLKAAAIGMMELPRLDAKILAGFGALGDLSGTTSDALDDCDIAGAVPASLLRPTEPRARIVGQPVTVLNRAVSERRKVSGLAEIEAHHLAEPGDVLVVQGVPNISSMGGVSATVGKRQGEAGAVGMVVGFRRGGGTDGVARILAPRLSELLGEAVVIDNRPGATGTVAAGHLAKSLPDGYTLMMGHVSVNAIAPSLFANLPYDVERDFAPIGLAAAVPHLVVVHPSLPVTTLRELIAHLKAQPGKFTFPSAGNGSMPHLAGEIFQSLAGVRLVHVPYKGTGQSMQDLLGGQHIVAFDTMAASAPHARSGKLRAVAVSTAQRVGSFPDVPTAEEAGLPGYVMTTWYGVFAPAGTPTLIVNRLHAELVKAMQTPDVRTKLEGIGADGSVSRTPHEFAQLVRADTARYAKIVKDIGLKIE